MNSCTSVSDIPERYRVDSPIPGKTRIYTSFSDAMCYFIMLPKPAKVKCISGSSKKAKIIVEK